LITQRLDEEMTIIEISSHLRLWHLPHRLAETFIKENQFRNPKFAKNQRMGFWNGKERPWIRLYRQERDSLILPRGYFPAVITALRAEGVRFEVTDRTICPTAGVPYPKGQLYPFQAQALEDLLRYPTGIMESPTGSGKTVVLLSVIHRLKTHALILVHTRELLNQTMERVESWLGIEPGVIGGGKENIRPVTVAMIQTLARRDLKESGIADYFGAVLVDEAHHSPATTWAKILQQLPAKYKYGFTATAWRKDGLRFLMWRLIGNKNARVTRQMVEAEGRMVWPDVEVVHTDYRYPIQDAAQWTHMMSNLVRNPERNQLIEREVRKRVNGDAHALVLTGRIEHANRLSRMLQDLAPVLLTGELSKADRVEAMKQVRSGAQLTIGTTSLMGEGVDVPRWNLLFLVYPISGGPLTLQTMGRVARPAPGKEKAVVVDFVDDGVAMLKAAFRKRQELYAA